MNQNRFSPAPDRRDSMTPAGSAPGVPATPATPGARGAGRMVAIVGAVALAATLAPVAIAAGLSSAQGEDAAALESVRTVVLGGDGATFTAAFDVRDGDPDCTREISLTVGAHQFTCGDVTIETRSADGVEDLPRFGARAIRAKLLADEPAPDLRPAETPRAPGVIAWSGSPVEGIDGTVHRVIVLGDEPAASHSGRAGEGADPESEPVDDDFGASALVAVISGDGDAVDDAAATILADVRAGDE